MGKIDFDTINDTAKALYPGLLESWIPGGSVQGGEYKALNPTRSDSKTGSFSVNVRTGKWGDFATGDMGGDPVSLYAYLQGLEQGEAAKRLDTELGGKYQVMNYAQRSTHSKKQPDPPAWVQVVPVPDDAPPAPQRHSRHGKPSKMWKYLDGYGRLIGWVARFDIDNGKEVLPLCYQQKSDGTASEWKWKGFDKLRPIYGLDRLAAMPDVNVVVVEGEKCADALQEILDDTAAVVSWPGGSKAVQHVDWSPLHGRRLIFWPDFDCKSYPDRHEFAGQVMAWSDQPGPAAMLKIIDMLRGEIEVARIIPHDPGVRPDGWDCADAAAEGWDSGQFLAFIRTENVDGLVSIDNQKPATENDIPPEPEASPLPEEYQTEEPRQADYAEDDDTGALGGLKNYFTLLGHDHGSFYFLSKGARQVVDLTADKMGKSHLKRLAPDQNWQKVFFGKSGPDYDAAQNALIQLSYKMGIYSPKRVRGCGAWEDKGRSVLHLGDHLVVDGTKTGIEHHDSHFIYEASEPMNTGGSIDPIPAQQAVKLLDLCKKLSWEKPISATLLAGWCVVAPICGALVWRPHIWTTGPAGSGKSWVVDNILALAVGPIALQVQSNTTEAGLRQALKYDARPVIFDEAEGEDKTAQKRIQNVLELMRQASTETGAEIIKGSTSGKAMTFRIRSCFAFSSIGVNLAQHADASRVTVLSLVRNTSPTAAADFEQIQRFWSEHITPDFARGLRARAVNLIPIIRVNAQTFSRAAAEHLGNQRAGDQIGALLAGAYSLHSSKKITLDAARAWVKDQDWGEVVAEEDGQDETRCLARIMEHVITVRGEKHSADLSVAELVDLMGEGREKGSITYREAEDALARLGVLVDPHGGTMTVSNTKGGIAGALRDSPWPKGWGLILSRVPGAAKMKPQRFGPGATSRGVMIPLSAIGLRATAKQAEIEY